MADTTDFRNGFSMLIDDGTVVELNVEENPTEVGVSGAEHMLGQL